MSRQWYLYIIENRLKQLYTGISTDVTRRFKEHQSGGTRGAKALRGKGPLILRLHLEMRDQGAALRAEHLIKSLSRKQKEALIQAPEKADIDGLCQVHPTNLE